MTSCRVGGVLADGADRPENAARLAARGLARWTTIGNGSTDRVVTLVDDALADTGYAARCAAVHGPDTAPGERTAARAIAALAGTTVVHRRAARMRLAGLTPAQRERLRARLSDRTGSPSEHG